MGDRGDNKQQPNSQQRTKGRITALLYAISILYAGHYITMLPLSQARKHIHNEGLMNIGGISRAQQAYFLEPQTFARRILDLGIGIRSESDNYAYRILSPAHPTPKRSFSPKTQNFPAIAHIAYPKHDNLQVYISIVQIEIYPGTNELTSRAVLCRSASSLDVLKSKRDLYFGFRSLTNFHQTKTRWACPIHFEELGK
ncbi:MAG: type IV pilin-like G/H family protein [Cyanobacteria bacterium P01_E01_bin.42]